MLVMMQMEGVGSPHTALDVRTEGRWILRSPGSIGRQGHSLEWFSYSRRSKSHGSWQ